MAQNDKITLKNKYFNEDNEKLKALTGSMMVGTHTFD